jgi:hypothetical protein
MEIIKCDPKNERRGFLLQIILTLEWIFMNVIMGMIMFMCVEIIAQAKKLFTSPLHIKFLSHLKQEF